MIERGLQSLNSVVASLRRDVDALEKRPICRGGHGGGTPPPPIGVSYGFVYGIKEATKGVHRITQSEIGPEIVQLPGSSNLSVIFEGTTSQQSVFTLYDGGRWRLVDLSTGQVGGTLPMPLQNGSVNDTTWYGQPSYVGTHTGGRRYAVVHQRKWGAEGAVVCADVGTGEVLAELRGNLPDVQRLDVQNPDSAPIVVRRMSGANGYQVYLARGGVFEHQYDLPMPGVDLAGSRWDGAYFTGLFRIEGGYGSPYKYFDIKTGVEVVAHGMATDFERRSLANGLYEAAGGIAMSIGGAPVFSFGVGFGDTNGSVLGHVVRQRRGELSIYSAGGNKVFTLADVPGFNRDDWRIIVDNHYAV